MAPFTTGEGADCDDEEWQDEPTAIPQIPTLQRGWAKGSCKAFLEAQLPHFKTATLAGRSKKTEEIMAIVNKYFEVYSWRLPVTTEPDAMPQPDQNEDLTAKEKRVQGEIIKRMTTFTGISSKLPKLQTRWQVFKHEKFKADMKATFNTQFSASGLAEGKRASKRNVFVIAKFNDLPPAVQEAYMQKGIEEHNTSKEVIEERAAAEHDLSPFQHQELIDRLAEFFGLLLTQMSKLLKMHISLLVGGPEPKHGGNLNVLSLHIGTNKAPIPQR
ncbi:hypothetical protein BDN71DRAFT_1513390 [Pleurotus eryngii]|uniref:Uncharacterized protein n=1 Tax=Pleurotus eryngii TaxID=5323 RepID=A0A9P5ZHY1_PLEER|nr:hypothetical protein BDN71DRAFT_1513390 [Pleurotus eryngii]